ncbi:hypothetical protein SNE510_29030 [Streptomyces sp. NE5-10]|uniref:hypothetical protein n=1 Tax=Streptomyces sp. NE5-10 TaxID=2759674 RepID=UPI001906BCA4|nr:hypothetical protein [Streptomyces sp. NE5-10]GHJ93384.1 hypothetical protein SNE510_29030 [Streptomyces sp. NE5-10]
MGVILWYQVDFPKLRQKISNDVLGGTVLADAEIVVRYEIGEPARFDITFEDLPLDLHKTLTEALGKKPGPDGGIPVDIRLGYLDDPSSREVALSGRVDTIRSSTRFPPLAMRLSGVEEAAYKLLNHTEPGSDPPRATLAKREATPYEAAKYIAERAKVELKGPEEPGAPARPISRTGKNSFELLKGMASDFGYEILVQDGAVQCGLTLSDPPKRSRFPVIPKDALLKAMMLAEECLVAHETMTVARLAEFKPDHLEPAGRQSLTTDPSDPADVELFDFTVLGVPSLRAGQMVAAGVEGYDKPLVGFRVLQLTHTFSTRNGYTCAGRAVEFSAVGGNHRRSELARKATPHSVADLIAGKAQERAAANPSVDVGEVDRATPDERVASVLVGQRPNEAMASPSVDVRVTGERGERYDKPVASPFAWHSVGLTVPVYPGMRALLNQVRDDPDDTVVTGFLWPNDPRTERPKAKDGDWWLCLPTELTVSGSPKPTGKGVNDLITAEGLRVVEAIGLTIAIGEKACSDVGERPTAGPAGVFRITHESGTTVTIDAEGKVTVDGGQQDVVLTSGGATLTIGKGKVAIS